MAESKRVLVLSDLHCGNMFGLTPPKYHNHHKEIQQVGWKFYTENIKKLGKIDLCIINGDAIDGPGKKDSRQHITTDMRDQVDIATECLKVIPAKKFLFVRGTCYHTTTDRENEDDIAKEFDAEIHDSRKIDVNGCVIHCKHSTGKGSSVYGSATPLQSGAAVQMLNDISADNIKADIFIRSHIHELIMIKRTPFSLIATPGLQFKGMAYGRKYASFYDYGMIWMDIRSKKDYDIHDIIIEGTNGNYKREGITKI
jgi:hypothetical protein